MSIEAREGSCKKYKYKSVRRNGSVKKIYVGSMADPGVSLLHRTEELKKAAAKAAASARQAEVRKAANNEIYLDALSLLVAKSRSVYRVLLLARVGVPPRWPAAAISGPQVIVRIERFLTMLPSQRSLRAICRGAENGDMQSREQLQTLIASTPEFVAQAVDLVAMAKAAFLDDVAAASGMTREVLSQSIEHRAAELVGRHAEDPLTHLLANTVVLCWMDLTRSQIAGSRRGISNQDVAFWGKNADRAQKRLLRASQSLRQHRESLADGRPNR